jgi:hypothetical protein
MAGHSVQRRRRPGICAMVDSLVPGTWRRCVDAERRLARPRRADNGTKSARKDGVSPRSGGYVMNAVSKRIRSATHNQCKQINASLMCADRRQLKIRLHYGNGDILSNGAHSCKATRLRADAAGVTSWPSNYNIVRLEL